MPGDYERSSDKTGPNEWAALIDTCRPWQLAEAALALDDGADDKSWLEPGRW